MKHKREDMPLLGQKINDYRKMKKGYTIEKFAEELGVCRATLQRYLVGKAIPLDKINQIAYLLEVPVQTLIDGTEVYELTYVTDDLTKYDCVGISFLFQNMLNSTLLKEEGEYDIKDYSDQYNLDEAYFEKIIKSFADDMTQYFKALSIKYRAINLLHSMGYGNQNLNVLGYIFDSPIIESLKHMDSVMKAMADSIVELKEELEEKLKEF